MTTTGTNTDGGGAPARSWSIVHTEASLGWGGQEIRIFREMEAMRERGHRCALAAQKESRLLQKCREAGFATFVFSERPLDFPSSILRLAVWLRRLRPDVVNTHSSKDGWIGGIAARLARVPLLIRSRHIEVDYPSRRRSRVAFGHLPNHVLTTSERIRERLIRELDLDPDRITCIPTGLGAAAFADGGAETRQERHARWGIPPGVPVVGMVSVLRSWKGHHIFLEALGRLRRRGVAFRAVIAGEGPRRAFIEKRIAELDLEGCATLIGHQEEVAPLLAALDVLAAPSIGHEGIPQIILQAHAAACPVVASRTGGIPEVVEDGVTGCLVEPGDADALADALERTLADLPARRHLAAAARSRVRERHTLDAMCRQLEALYSSLL